MGKPGQTAALEAADIVLLRDDLGQLPWLINKARAGKRLLVQNVIIALAAMTLGSIAAVFGGLPLWAGVVLHEGGTLLVSLNGLRQLKS
jgi:Cd2+/Zn2+-exporting ATPase